MKLRTALILATVATLLVVGSAASCPVCYGANDSPMNAGMNTAILLMLGITGMVLSSIVAFVLWMWKRRKQNRLVMSENSSVNEHGVLEVKSKKGVAEWNIS